jgi:transcriptional regulator GlxA family with amidase domain
LNHFRIAKAQELLSSTNKSIADVGIEVGFCDQSYFGLTFRRHTQMTPMQYRNKAQEPPWSDESDNPPDQTPKAKSVAVRIT